MGVTNGNGYTLTIKIYEKEGIKVMTKELEKILESVCGTYENDCSKFPKQKECEEYQKISGIYEIVNR